MPLTTAFPATASAVASVRAPASRSRPKGELTHRVLVYLAATVASVVILFLAAYGYAYYSLPIEERPFSPLHSQLRSSGSIGLKLGFLSIGMFCALFLYPLRKRWRWLGSKGITRRWLNFHVLLGLTTPVIVTFHTSFKSRGLAGVAYWTMISVALSGLIGRYVYAKIPRSISTAKLTVADLETQTTELVGRLGASTHISSTDLAPLLNVPSTEEIRRMSLPGALWFLVRTDVARPFQLSRLRRHRLKGSQRILTIGGFLSSHNRDVEALITNVKRQSRLSTAMAFLDRMERVFHLWHVIHRPFSISFVVLISVHIGVALSVGF
jgi:hypothetical protein